MNYKLLCAFLFLGMASLSHSYKQSKNCDFIGNVVSGFDNEKLLQIWIKSGDSKCEKSVILLKEIVGRIKEILIVIDRPEYCSLKDLIIVSDIEFGYEIEYPYFEMCVVVKSINNILKQRRFYRGEILDVFDTDIRYRHAFNDLIIMDYECIKSSNDFENMITEIVLVEYNYIYGCIVKDLFNTVIDYIDNDHPSVFQLQFSQETRPLFESKVRVYSRLFFYNSRDIISKIFVLDKTQRAFVLASADGITFSKKCWWFMSNNFLTNENIILFPIPQFQKLEFRYSTNDIERSNMMKNFIYKRFVQNKVATSLLISLIHFYTMKSGQDTKYEIYQIEIDLYEIRWSYVTPFDKIYIRYF